MSNPFVEWTNGLKREQIDIWRESLAHLRQLHNDVWNGVKFFLTINGILLAAIAALMRDAREVRYLLVLCVAAIGLAVTIIARQILTRHREYYLQMLIRKTLIEDALGFNTKLLRGVDVVFPWSPLTSPEDLSTQPHQWLKEQIRRRGTISKRLFLIYEGTAVVHILIAILAGTGALAGGISTSQSTSPHKASSTSSPEQQVAPAGPSSASSSSNPTTTEKR